MKTFGGNPKAMLALGRLKAGAMNKTEAAYANHLEVRRLAGEIAWWAFEPIKIRIADKTFYTPDFMVMYLSGEVSIHETKGFFQDDARVKIKAANELLPFNFYVVRKDGRGWTLETVGNKR